MRELIQENYLNAKWVSNKSCYNEIWALIIFFDQNEFAKVGSKPNEMFEDSSLSKQVLMTCFNAKRV